MSNLPVAVLLCPGRGSYGREELGSIARHLQPGALADVLAAADRRRRENGWPTVGEMDGAAQFRPGLHLHGPNAAELIWFATLAQLAHLRARYEIVAVAGNSLGWYTALPAAGVLSVADGWRLVSTMARLQDGVAGGQLLTTLVDDAWQQDDGAVAELTHALADVGARGTDHFVATSIRLGGHAVLAGTEIGVQALTKALPRRKVGEREFPFRLAGHGPFHTPLCHAVAEQATAELRDLPTRMPDVHLIDGFGNLHTPWSADPRALLAYTTGAQVVETFDFTAAVRTAIREFNPDVLLCAGPGATLRAPVGHVVLREGYRGIRTRDALFASNLIRVE